MEKKHSLELEAFYRNFILPEEDKDKLTPPRCGFRWFKSKNIACTNITGDRIASSTQGLVT